MKQITMFYLPSCPYCRKAIGWNEELRAEQPEYAALEIKMVDESREKALAESFDYYYVPCYYVDGEKLHEGAATKEKIEEVFKAAL